MVSDPAYVSARDGLVQWLLNGGYAEERRGYGHCTAEELADALIAAGWIQEELF